MSSIQPPRPQAAGPVQELTASILPGKTLMSRASMRIGGLNVSHVLALALFLRALLPILGEMDAPLNAERDANRGFRFVLIRHCSSVTSNLTT